MERHHLKKHANDSSSRLATQDDFNALTNSVIALAQSVTDYVYKMGEHDEDAYDSRGEIFEEDVDYIARGDDCHYIPMLEDEIANYYNPPPLQNQQEREVDHFIGQYFDNAGSNLNYNSRQDDEKQEEPTLAQLMSQMIAIQAQQGKEIQLLTSELQQERAARKILETQLAQHAASSLHNPWKSPSQPDVRRADANVVALKSENAFEKSESKAKVSTEVVEEDEQFEQGKVKEAEEQETPYVAPPAYVPPILFSHRQIKVPVETNDNYIDVCQLTFFESEVLSNKHAENSDTLGNNLTGVMKKSFHEGPEILICNTRLKDEPATSLPGH